MIDIKNKQMYESHLVSHQKRSVGKEYQAIFQYLLLHDLFSIKEYYVYKHVDYYQPSVENIWEILLQTITMNACVFSGHQPVYLAQIMR